MSLLLALVGAQAPKEPEFDLERELQAEEKRIISPEEFRAGVVLVTDPRLVQYLAEHPDELTRMNDRQFEEFIAEFLKKLGYEVRLGPRGKDGGVDVTAERQNLYRELVLVQCKRYSPENRVGPAVVKQLYADVEQRDATSGLVVTTSSFTRDALKFIESVKYRVTGHDLDRLKKWLSAAHDNIAGGLWR